MANAYGWYGFAPYLSSPKPNLFLVQQKLGVYWRNSALLKIALTHSSYLNENPDENPECNERLEFLGDAVLGLAIAAALYSAYQDLQEGDMTQIRSLVVSGSTLASVARRLALGEFLLMGNGEEKGGGRNRDSNLAAAFEAIVGALALDNGYTEAEKFCISILNDEIDDAYKKVTSPSVKLKPKKKSNQSTKPGTHKSRSKNLNIRGKHPKSMLQEISQARHGKPPVYRITKATGKSNDMTFTAQVQIKGKTLGSGTGSSKKAAETEAAKAALATMT